MRQSSNYSEFGWPKSTVQFCVLFAVGLLSVSASLQTPTASVALAAARKAVSPSGAPLVGLRITGTLSVHRTDGSKDTHPVEVRIRIPSSYLRIDREAELVRQSGFNEGALLNKITPTRPSAQVVSQYPPDQIETERARFRRLLLGLAAVSLAGSEVTAVERAVVDGHAVDLLHMTDVRLKELKLGVTPSDGMPLVVVVRQSVVLPLKPGEAIAGRPPAQTLDVYQWFEDRREVFGHRLPFVIRTVAGGIELERLTVTTIDVNAALGPHDFDK